MDDATNLLLNAASSATSAATNILETVRNGWEDRAQELESAEVPEHLADALQAVLSITHEAAKGAEKEMQGQLLAAVRRFLEGWA